jgi:ParB family chromosome partitioning protein
MNADGQPAEVRMIPVDSIDVLNPRERNSQKFDEIVGNIRAIGLKKPITVTPRHRPNGDERFLLVCGEGRLKAFRILGQPSIPALVVEVCDEDALIMSLTENIARRQYRSLELLVGIEELRVKGYSAKQIATKTGLSMKYVQGMLTLLQHSEGRLLAAVERGDIPLNAALDIVGAGDDDQAVQTALQQAYEAGTLRGKALLNARRLVEKRKSFGKYGGHRPHRPQDVTASSVVRAYQKEVERQQQVVRRAEFTQRQLLFVVTALRRLFDDEGFVTLLRAEGLDTLPKYLAEMVHVRGGHG